MAQNPKQLSRRYSQALNRFSCQHFRIYFHALPQHIVQKGYKKPRIDKESTRYRLAERLKVLLSEHTPNHKQAYAGAKQSRHLARQKMRLQKAGKTYGKWKSVFFLSLRFLSKNTPKAVEHQRQKNHRTVFPYRRPGINVRQPVNGKCI